MTPGRWGLLVGLLCAFRAGADPAPVAPGYTLASVSDGVPAAFVNGITQFAFRPGDPSRLFAARSYTNTITRYDVDAATGALSNAVNVATGLPSPHGLAFRGDVLYVSLNPSDSSRIARLRDLDLDGVYEERRDFVRGVPKRDHGINQLQIVGASLFAPIGTKWNSGAPTCETAYTGAIARIADLDLIDYASGANYLPAPTEFANSAPVDGYLRRYAYGLRNPFGLRVDGAGNVWASDNGASFCNTCSPCSNFPIDTADLFYKEVPVGAKGHFPPDGYPGGGGATITPAAILATHAAATGFAWISTGPDAGRVALAQYGATNPQIPAGRDVVMVDAQSGVVSPLVSDLVGPTDVLADALGRLYIADFEGTVYLLTPPGITAVATPHARPRSPRIENIAPNPANTQMVIAYSLPARGPVILTIVDIAGREVARFDEGERVAGTHVRRWILEGDGAMRAGVYICRIETSGGIDARRFAIVR